MGGCALGSAFEPAIPVLEQCFEVSAEVGELAETGFDGGEFLFRERPYLAARRRAPLPFSQDHRQFRERETEGKRAAHQEDARERRLRIDPVIGGRTRGLREHAHPLVMAQGVGADARAARQFPGCDAHVRHYRARNAFQGQEAFF